MTDLELDPAVIKLLEYCKNKESITWDEVNDILPETLTGPANIESVLQLMVKHNIQIIEEDNLLEEDEDDAKGRTASPFLSIYPIFGILLIFSSIPATVLFLK